MKWWLIGFLALLTLLSFTVDVRGDARVEAPVGVPYRLVVPGVTG